MINAISPIDGRYEHKTLPLQQFFSEFALIRYRIKVEIEYFIALSDLGLEELESLTKDQKDQLRSIYQNFQPKDAEEVKKIEAVTNHDVKAVEYFIKERFKRLNQSGNDEFVHFGLTSQDINNTAVPLSISDALKEVLLPAVLEVIEQLKEMEVSWKEVPMMARTHGQPASPTRLGKEVRVFRERLEKQLTALRQLPIEGKFGGATGNFNAHLAAYPEIQWESFADQFLDQLGLQRQSTTTQIEHYDQLAALFHNFSRINTILIDLCRDFWTYISMNYFLQNVVENEVGSSAMPHKVNPIDFENAEGNLGLANSLFEFLARKLPVSRLQRDLTDSTVSRNIGLPFAHSLIAFKSIQKGLGKLKLNQKALERDLDQNWMVLAEPIQTVLRKLNYPQPYEALKKFSRGKGALGKKEIHEFIDQLEIDEAHKKQLKQITPFNYTGNA